MSNEHPLHDLAMAIRYDLTAAQGKITELLRQIGELELPESTSVQCGFCGIERPNALVLAEHEYQQHGGLVPAHWLAIEARSEEAA